MALYNVDAEVREINRYEFSVEAATPEEAEKKLAFYLKHTPPCIFEGDTDLGIFCADREAAMVTEDVVKITVR